MIGSKSIHNSQLITFYDKIEIVSYWIDCSILVCNEDELWTLGWMDGVYGAAVVAVEDHLVS